MTPVSEYEKLPQVPVSQTERHADRCRKAFRTSESPGWRFTPRSLIVLPLTKRQPPVAHCADGAPQSENAPGATTEAI
jgi:hypothetical protein